LQVNSHYACRSRVREKPLPGKTFLDHLRPASFGKWLFGGTWCCT
jgi:hypothetical protein